MLAHMRPEIPQDPPQSGQALLNRLCLRHLFKLRGGTFGRQAAFALPQQVPKECSPLALLHRNSERSPPALEFVHEASPMRSQSCDATVPRSVCRDGSFRAGPIFERFPPSPIVLSGERRGARTRSVSLWIKPQRACYSRPCKLNNPCC